MYKLTVGLEIHAELKTATKMFCACRNESEAVANSNVCPVCMAHPGTLPVINKEAVRKVLLMGTAVGGTLADYTEFDRKNYFYPDIPKGYQISQYEHPLVKGGTLANTRITRIHLEEDTARSQHQGESSLVDYNRAGVPLMELVTEPEIYSAEQAGAFARELQLLLRCLGAGEANMEKGEMRVEANISVAPDRGSATEKNVKDGKQILGTKVEVKNLNSFRSVERAIAYEFERQTRLLEEGGVVEQETRGWDESAQKTFLQRKKESSHDYRYFPDPDLPSLRISEIPEFASAKLREALPELPWAKRARYVGLGLKPEDADMFVAQPDAGALFDATIAEFGEDNKKILLAANYIANDLAGAAAAVVPTQFAALISMIAEGTLSSRGAKDALAEAVASKDNLTDIAQKYLQQSDTGTLQVIAAQVVEQNPSVVADYKAGKQAALQFLLGQGMKLSRGSANPEALRTALLAVLG
jgi:aspartyl-tRNA(Asn)/glutamyl-tRNA(Gln) amidotransferase subunit B